ncbi:hypothetical protein CYJ91_02070 [Lacticaseibacillus rhamnosus]|uniref:Uncharacterized protein n=1 Tax=Lacticaseibacillus rhamnosus TaxID=47715 RepID=A0AAP8J2Q2_LACRH|nr:hypothetical protein CYJ91_02070 [Lacticaseibacillus rhamnosus]
MARFWPLRLRSLHADFCAGERVMMRARAGAVRDRSISSLGRDGPALAIATKVLTRRLLRRGVRPKTSFQLIKTCSNA